LRYSEGDTQMDRARGAIGRFGLLAIGIASLWVAMGLVSSREVLEGEPTSIAGAAYEYPGHRPERVTDQAIPTSPLGTEEQCKSRLGPSGEEYCSDLFLALGDLETFWKEEFLKVAGKNQRYSPPKRFTYYRPQGPNTRCNDPKTPGLYCTPAAYLFAGEVTINEPSLRSIHDKGDFGAMIILAHEWGHHISNLLGRYLVNEEKTSFTIQDELAADCFAGVWTYYEDEVLGQLEDGDIVEAYDTVFSAGDEELEDWQDEDAHGWSQQRVLAYRLGWEYGSAEVCTDWFIYDGQPRLDLGKYYLAVTPPDEAFELKDNKGYRIESGDIVALVAPQTKLAAQTAERQFPTVAKDVLGATARLLDFVNVRTDPDSGVLPRSELTRMTKHASTYEQTVDGQTYHGVFYLNVRPGGTGIAIDVFAKGKASGADWKPLYTQMNYLLLGLSLK
jgi:predicted metalloprotease